MVSQKLSVIIPVYNVEEYLAGCLDSVIAQTYENLEIICVDDGSTDNSPAILRQYADRDARIRIITQKNMGQSVARNAGLAAATSEYIAFIDSDDTLHPETYMRAIAQMAPDIDWVQFGIRVVGDSDAERQANDNEYYRVKYSGKNAITTDLILCNDVSPCNKIFRKSIIDKYGIDFPVGLRYEDAYFCFVYGMRSRNGFFIQDRFYNYFRHAGSIMHQTRSVSFSVSIDHLKIAIRLYEYLRKYDLFDMYRNFYGHVFFSWFDFAFRNEQTGHGRAAIYDMAINFLNKEKICFDQWDDLVRMRKFLLNRVWDGRCDRKICGLIKVGNKIDRCAISFCGVPVLRINYTSNCTKWFLFRLIRIRKKGYGDVHVQ